MPKAQHHPWENKTYNKGANLDAGDDFVGQEGGEYIDSLNMRPTEIGDQGFADKIKGEKLLFNNQQNDCHQVLPFNAISGTWECMAALEINNDIVELWADTDKIQDTFIRVNGKIVLQSASFPVNVDDPIQVDKDESCVGGVFVICDDETPPIILNVEDMLTNGGVGDSAVCSQKYFDDFDIRSFTIGVEIPPDHPIFLQMITSGAGAGVDVGAYQYALRFKDSDGNFSRISVATPQIPVNLNRGLDANIWPALKTYNSEPNPTTPTRYAPQIRFRVTNLFSFASVQVVRYKHINGSIIGVAPTIEAIYEIEIATQEIDFITFTDGESRSAIDSSGASRGASLDDEVISLQEESEILGSIESAKTPRFFNNRLYLANIKYASRDTDGDFTFKTTNGKEMFPVRKDIGVNGLQDEYNHVYYKPNMSGEKYGFAVVPYDSSANAGFATDVDNFTDFQMPNRRQATTADTDTFSYGDAVKAGREDGTIGNCHEVFDMTQAQDKNKRCGEADSFKNILDDGSKSLGKITSSPNCPEDPGHGSTITGSEVGYEPYHPVSQNDTDVLGHEYQPDIEVDPGTGFTDYNPKGFRPNYFSTGMALSGLNTFPDWMQSFSMVRREPAKRVVAQGIGMYSLISGEFNAAFGNKAVATKEKEKIWFYSPDLDTDLAIDPTLAADIATNPTDYEVELVSPLGFFTEMYSGESDTIGSRDKLLDMISYARVLRDKLGAAAEINIDETADMGVADADGFNYVMYGKWRSPNFTVFTNGDGTDVNGDLRNVPMTSFTAITEGRGGYHEIAISASTPFYGVASSGGTGSNNFLDPGLKDWHEPMYIINIVQKGRTVSANNINRFIHTGHYQKVNAIIAVGVGAGLDLTTPLVDERWEDCIPDLDSGGAFAGDDVFAFIDDGTGDDEAWIDVTFKAAGTITTILTDIQNDGFHITGGGTIVFGVYTHINTNDKEFSLVFNWFDTSFSPSSFRPDSGSFIRVKYSTRLPIRFWGGDSNIGEAIFSPLDREGTAGGDPGPGTGAQQRDGIAPNNFIMNAGWPYYKFHINDRDYIIADTQGINKIQDINKMDVDWIRQLCVMATLETRTNIHLGFNDIGFPTGFTRRITYPQTHYIKRPNRWDTGADPSAQNIFSDYENDYPNELGEWIHGGLRYQPKTNIDLVKDDQTETIVSRPQVGFEEQNEFCTRVIWSVTNQINDNSSPGYKTFPVLNAKDISDDTGEIKKLWSATTGKRGGNIYAFTDGGTFLLLTDKRTITELGGNELATVSTDGIVEEISISKDIGISDELWRAFAEFNNICWFINKNSAYRFDGNAIVDIGRQKYHSMLYARGIKFIGDAYTDKVTGHYDVLNNEYLCSIKFTNNITISVGGAAAVTVNNGLYSVTTTVAQLVINMTPAANVQRFYVYCTRESELLNVLINTVVVANLTPGDCMEFVRVTKDISVVQPFSGELTSEPEPQVSAWSEVSQYWIGRQSWDFDQFLASENRSYGFRDLVTFDMNKGFTMNGVPVVAQMDNISNAQVLLSKEFIKWRVNGDQPTKIEVLDGVDGNVIAVLDSATFGNFYLKDYGQGWEQNIPRSIISRLRQQGLVMYFRITHDTATAFKVKHSQTQYKLLK